MITQVTIRVRDMEGSMVLTLERGVSESAEDFAARICATVAALEKMAAPVAIPDEFPAN